MNANIIADRAQIEIHANPEIVTLAVRFRLQRLAKDLLEDGITGCEVDRDMDYLNMFLCAVYQQGHIDSLAKIGI